MEIKKLANLPAKINSVPTSAYPLPAVRPEFSVLNKSRIKTVYDISISSWEKSLQKCIQKIIDKENER
jgi:dTDP-4-dehydrorhamnose reductase